MSDCHDGVRDLLAQTRELRLQLHTHPLYSSIRTIDHVHRFMESHVFAVWDFMSLLKTLQRGLTCVEVPWISAKQSTGRLINEIVRDEETDLNLSGEPVSHFELYRAGMLECGASTACIDLFLELLKTGCPTTVALDCAGVPAGANDFVRTTFRIIKTGQLHQVAAAFAFGREDLVPEMFTAIIHEMKSDIPGLETFHYYLARHIELDGGNHGPHAHKMVSDLCGDDAQRWKEAVCAATEALLARIHLWDSIVDRNCHSTAEPLRSVRGA